MLQNQKYRRLRPEAWILLLLVVLLATGCATKIKVNMLKPAPYHQASLTKTIAVLPFSGKNGSEFAAELEGILGSINIDDKPYLRSLTGPPSTRPSRSSNFHRAA